MILLFNIIQTPQRRNYNRYYLSKPDYIDVWKYTLASLAVIPWWSKICIYCEFDPIYHHRREEMETYIHSLFPQVPIELYFRRNLYQKEWQTALEPLFDFDPLIFYLGNDDHPFMDYNLDCLSEIHSLMLQDEPSTCFFSHWPEILRIATTCNPRIKNLSLKIDYVESVSVQIIHREIMKQWFWNKDYGNVAINRTDMLSVDRSKGSMYVPLRELFRHFDGYSHIYSDVNAAPALDIPPGFFENDIKITYCSPSKQPGTVHVNPLLKTHFAIDGRGADYHWTFDDIPLFWKNKITEFKVVEVFDELEIIKSRNESYARKALMWHESINTVGRPNPPPMEWIVKSFR